MISQIFEHLSEILGFRARVIEGTFGMHKSSTHVSLFMCWFNDKSSFKHPFETFGFHVRMIEWTLESYKLLILSFPSFFIIQWWTSYLQKTQSRSPNPDEGINEKGFRVATPHPMFIVFVYPFIYHIPWCYDVILLCAMFHVSPLCVIRFDIYCVHG